MSCIASQLSSGLVISSMGNRHSYHRLPSKETNPIRRPAPIQRIDSSTYEPSISYLYGYLNKVGDDMDREKAFNHLKFITNFIYSLNGIPYDKSISSNNRSQRV